MRTTIHTVTSAFMLMLLFGCAQPPTTPLNAKITTVTETCSEPRPMICTMVYTPVCGLRGADWQTYSNGCSACSDAEVSGYRAGECTEK